MRRPRFGPKRPPLVSKVRRTQKQAYGTRETWFEVIKRIKNRDGNKCRCCGRTEFLQVDHIIQVSKGGRSNDANLWTLCVYCHSKRPGHKKAKNLILHKRKKKQNEVQRDSPVHVPAYRNRFTG